MPVAFITCFGKGYLAPLGFLLILIVLSQIIAALIYGEYFPKSIPAFYSGLTGEVGNIDLSGFLIVFITSLAGIIATLFWWLTKDHE